MITLVDLDQNDVSSLLNGTGIGIKTGPFWVKIRSDAPSFTEPFRTLYANHPADPVCALADFHVSIDRTSWIRDLLKPQILFHHDGEGPFYPLPAAEAAVMLEWGLNWCVSTHAHQYLIIHAAIAAKGDDAVLMSAVSRSGKSTLTAALVHRGWRLLSDELALIDTEQGLAWPLCRPVNLKGSSIALIRSFEPKADLAGHAVNAHKGDVALMRPTTCSIMDMDRPARVRWLIEPVYTADAEPMVFPVNRGEAMRQLIDNSFNYGILGEAGFRTLAGMVKDATCHRFHYSNLDDAVAGIEDLTGHGGGQPS